MDNAAVFGFIVCIGAIMYLIAFLSDHENHKNGFDRGWDAHARIHKLYELTDDEEALLKECKLMLKCYLATNDLKRHGDIKMIDNCTDFAEFKDVAFQTTVLRREKV